jgi:hypothetical protein
MHAYPGATFSNVQVFLVLDSGGGPVCEGNHVFMFWRPETWCLDVPSAFSSECTSM